MAAGRYRAAAMVVVAMTLAGALVGCDETPAPAPAPVPVVASPAAAAPAHAGIVLSPQPGANGTTLTNDPSAPVDTPLCGMAARERVGIDKTVLSRQYADAGICSSFACYDAATATYIGADGYHHVCR